MVSPQTARIAVAIVLGAVGGSAWAGDGEAKSPGRLAAEALPPGRFRTALLAELDVLDARRPRNDAAEMEIVVLPPPALPETVPPAAVEAEPPRLSAAEPLASEPSAPRNAAPAADRSDGRGVKEPGESTSPFLRPLTEPAAKQAVAEESRIAAVSPQTAMPQANASRTVTPFGAERPAAERSAAESRQPAPPSWVDPFAGQTDAEADRMLAQRVARPAAETPGFGPYCPVTLRDEFRLTKASAAVTATHDGIVWRFATPAARQAFLKSPTRYQAAADG
ncbi:MAG: hypothetical protein AAF907_01540, partial [Planctomycetota bacterium]